jgi:hypothetical protein
MYAYRGPSITDICLYVTGERRGHAVDLTGHILDLLRVGLDHLLEKS